ncbi:MAG: SRPBCC family protein [Acidobacteria bacterium]|nr:SRPBCC family protein [Acidobacteriota bacterium]MBV9071186.1 SRPBCC family protein [Acidobacteriota bacterium]MBV9188558.1 SRPBCC family protein [Acidobacteriota bacterium]
MSLRFTARSVIRTTPEQLFAFHELPDAFPRLLPPGETIRVVQTAPNLEAGSRTIVRIRIAFLWVTFESLHTGYDPPHSFEDQQVRGPFRSWRHRHIVEPHAEGATLIDDIEYTPPFGILGRAADGIVIKPRLRKVFAFRHRVTREYCENARP